MWDNYNSAPPRRTAASAVSLVLHTIVLVWLFWEPTPQFIQPSSVRWGERGTSVTPIYLARKGAEELLPAAQASRRAASAIRYSTKRNRAKQNETVAAQSGNQEQGTSKTNPSALEGPPAGSPYGSLSEGPSLGEEVKPALPVYGPQPQIASYEIPTGLEGDIVVEITIDAQGNVTRTLLLRGLGHGLDEKVMAVLPTWRFHPATRDGVPIPSRQDVYFHFPHPA